MAIPGNHGSFNLLQGSVLYPFHFMTELISAVPLRQQVLKYFEEELVNFISWKIPFGCILVTGDGSFLNRNFKGDIIYLIGGHTKSL